ncbi:MAG: hypothetical protein Q7K28_00180 [Candidatus Wildermuthbacteria bacterium]|nr:hypothetical protein [Candidatus Wildermuthbacteria bacterium]
MNFENLKSRLFGDKEKSKQETSPKEKYKSSPQEIVLESRDFEREGELLGGYIGGARFVKIRDDGGGVFKPHSRFESRRKSEFIARERAAYLISRFLGFDFVPPTIIKVVSDKEGSLQEFVEDARIGGEVEYDEIDPRERDKLRIFDYLIANTDRHGGNYLFKDGKIFAIDHGYTLSPENFTDYFNISVTEIPPDIAINLKRFVESEEQKSILRDLLTELLGKSVANKFIKRVIAFTKSINT